MRDSTDQSSFCWSRHQAGRNGYKMCTVLIVIVLLALWSVLSGSAWLAKKWNAPELQAEEQVDVLDMEIREKLVCQMWDKYRHNIRLKISTFWQDAFEAAYEELESENPTVKQAAIAEIARLSVDFFEINTITHKPVQVQSNVGSRMKHNVSVMSIDICDGVLFAVITLAANGMQGISKADSEFPDQQFMLLLLVAVELFVFS